MALFAYRAIDAEGKVSSGNLDAVNAIDLELRLKRLGLDLLTFESAHTSAAARSRRISRTELITFCFHLSQLLKAGVNIIEALTDLRDSMENPGFKQVVASLLEDIEGGLKLSEAMANHSYCFDGVFVSLVRAGEQSGELTQVLDELTENIKWQDEMASQAKRALIYPVIVFVVIIGVIFVLMTVLVPQLAEAFKTLVPKLPPETEFMIALSKIFVKWWYLMLGIPALVITGGWIYTRTNDNARRWLDEQALKVPILGAIRQKIILARFSTFFAMLYRAGISVLECIHICEKIVGNRVMEEGLARVGRTISEGTGITAAFTNTRLFPPLVLRMLRVGETTGALDAALLNVSYFYNREVRESIARMQQMLGPLTTVVLGTLIVGILYTIFLPIYDVIGKIKL
ncbi:type II secretion system F family protein [Usitatibacter palustris]|uniref:Type II secretion system protein F n=1 Tax=Usitatibacter palustris TaxID=2732487 RepID=A0A6M4HCY5_9PROT|nr:type II secretion system F family protein [Usitatibacter palustris]QJR16394.1 Type II secretion system protein F [Usitatibacter palustris]